MPPAVLTDEHAASASPQNLDHIAYLLVHYRAVASKRALSVLKICAISGTRGQSGFGFRKHSRIGRRTNDVILLAETVVAARVWGGVSTFRNRQGWAPVVLQYVEVDGAD